MTRRSLPIRFVLACCFVGFCFAGFAAAGDGLRPFGRDSLDAVREQYNGEPFILALWSLTCAPCYEELAFLAQLKRRQPALNIVLVATDDYRDPGQRRRLERTLEEYALGDLDNRAFAGEARRIRYAIDPQWYGELPRSYFYDAGHQRRAVSGLLDDSRIREMGFGTGAP